VARRSCVARDVGSGLISDRDRILAAAETDDAFDLVDERVGGQEDPVQQLAGLALCRVYRTDAQPLGAGIGG
jgi:hypothetical protein